MEVMNDLKFEILYLVVIGNLISLFLVVVCIAFVFFITSLFKARKIKSGEMKSDILRKGILEKMLNEEKITTDEYKKFTKDIIE